MGAIGNTIKVARRAVAYSVRANDAGALGMIPRWVASLGSGRSPLADGRPWVTFRAQDWLDGVVSRGMVVREYGCGGSTVYFAERGASLRAVEHDAEWHGLVVGALSSRGLVNAEALHVPADAQAEDGSHGSARDGRSYSSYASVFDGEPDASVDLVSVDGRARVACARHAEAKLKPGGWLVLDNADRAEYGPVFERLASWERVEFPGPGPYARRPWLTVAWRKP